MKTGLHLVSVIIPVLLILLSPEPPCFPLQECKITTMVRAETFQIFQYDVLALRNHRSGRVWTSPERKHISYCDDAIQHIQMLDLCAPVQA